MGRKKKIAEETLFDHDEIWLNSAITIPSKIEELNDDGKLCNANIIKNIGYDQTEILHNIGKLYNNGSDQFDADMTASSLCFYNGVHGGKYNIPEPKILMDVFPQREDIIKIGKWEDLPLEDNSIHSLVIDLPFVISPAKAPSAVSCKDGSNLISKRFASYYPVDNLYLSYYHWIKNAYRVLDDGGICIFKCENMISGGVRHNVEEFSVMAAQRVGFTVEDKFILLAKARLISPSKYKNGQVHSRNYTSAFYVFIKNKKKNSKNFFYEDLLNRCEKESEEKFINVVEK